MIKRGGRKSRFGLLSIEARKVFWLLCLHKRRKNNSPIYVQSTTKTQLVSDTRWTSPIRCATASFDYVSICETHACRNGISLSEVDPFELSYEDLSYLLRTNKRKLTSMFRGNLKNILGFITNLPDCTDKQKDTIFDFVTRIPAVDKEIDTYREPVFMTRRETLGLSKKVNEIDIHKRRLRRISEVSTGLGCGVRTGEKYKIRINWFALDENGLIKEIIFGCGKLEIPKEFSKQGKSPSHPMGVVVPPFARVILNEYIQSLYSQGKTQTDLLFPPLNNKKNKRRPKTQAYTGGGYFHKFRKQLQEVLIDQMPDSYLIDYDLRHTCSDLIQQLDINSILADIKKLGGNINKKHLLIPLTARIQLRHDPKSFVEGMRGDTNWVHYTSKQIGWKVFYYIIAKAFSYFDDPDKLDAWEQQYYYGEKVDTATAASQQNNAVEPKDIITIAKERREWLRDQVKMLPQLKKGLSSTVYNAKVVEILAAMNEIDKLLGGGQDAK